MSKAIFVNTIIIRIEFDANKRNRVLAERGLDFARAAEVFAGPTVTLPDNQHDYGELRFITVGALDDRMVVLVRTPRGESRRVVSMRKANEREQTRLSLG